MTCRKEKRGGGVIWFGVTYCHDADEGEEQRSDGADERSVY